LSLACIGINVFSVVPARAIVLDPATKVTGTFGDDVHSSTLYTDGSGNPVQVTSCPWIMPALQGAGFTNNNWNFSFAGAAASQFFFNDITVVKYEAQVGTPGKFTDPAGTVWGGYYTNQEAGGAYFQLKYTPQAGDPQNVHWIQAVNSTYGWGTPAQNSVHLDWDGSATPFYDNFSAAGSNYFFDVPFAKEFEYEGHPVADVQFQVFLAVDNIVGGTNNVTMYGGEWWGYQYDAVEIVPEPTIGALIMFGIFSVSIMRRRCLKSRRT
jgi:hypothetical protein